MRNSLGNSEDLLLPVIERLGKDARTLFDGRKMLAIHRRTNLTTHHSHLAWVDAVFQDGIQTFVIKIPRPSVHSDPTKDEKVRDRLEKEFQRACFLAEKFKGLSGFGVVKAIACFPDIPALVMEDIQGNNLRELIIRKGQWFPRRSAIKDLERACFAAGKWLKTFQVMTAQPGQQISLSLMTEYVDIRLNVLIRFGIPGVDQKWRTRILEQFERSRVDNSELGVAGVHGDFSLSNVVYSGKETVLIDFSNLETGSVYYDLTRFYHQLGLLLHKPSFGTATISRLRKAFVAGYDEKLNEASPLFRLFMVQHLVCHWLGRLKMAEPSFHARAYNYWICYRHRQELDRFLVVGDGYAF